MLTGVGENNNYASKHKEFLDSEAEILKMGASDAAKLNKHDRIESRLTAGVSNEEAPTPLPASSQDNVYSPTISQHK